MRRADSSGPTAAARRPTPSARPACPAAGASLEMRPQAEPAQREPGVDRDRAAVLVGSQRQRIEAGGAVLDLRERDRARLQLEARPIELDALPHAPRLVRISPAQIQIT